LFQAWENAETEILLYFITSYGIIAALYTNNSLSDRSHEKAKLQRQKRIFTETLKERVSHASLTKRVRGWCNRTRNAHWKSFPSR